MPLAWFDVPMRVGLDGGQPLRYCAMNDFNAQIFGDGGDWSEVEHLGNAALVKVRASDATLALIGAEPGFFPIPTRFFRLEDSFADLTAGERNQIENAVLSLGYTQGELDAAMGSTLAQWRARTLNDLLGIVASRWRRPAGIVAGSTIFELTDWPGGAPRAVDEVAATVV